MGSNAMAKDPDRLSKDRIDFVKRLFAVTVSVGFAGQLSHIIASAPHPTEHHLDVWPLFVSSWRPSLLLLSSVCAVVASWDGYLAAVDAYKLNDAPRFYIDLL
jgi:hypothetical protein